MATGLEKVSFHSNPKEGQCQRMFKLSHNCYHLIHSKVVLKILQTGLQQCMNHDLPDVQDGFRKAEEAEIKLPISAGSSKKQESSQKKKKSTSALLIMPKPLTVLITTNCKILKEMGIPDHLICLLRNLYAGQEATVRTGHETMDWFQIGKGLYQGCILSSCLFNLYTEYFMRNARLDESQAGIKIAGRNINNLRNADDTILMAESEKELKNLVMKVKEEGEKAGLKLNIQKTMIMASSSIPPFQIDGETMETVTNFILGGSKITADGDCSHEIKRRLFLGRKVMTNLDSILKSGAITLLTNVV